MSGTRTPLKILAHGAVGFFCALVCLRCFNRLLDVTPAIWMSRLFSRSGFDYEAWILFFTVAVIPVAVCTIIGVYSESAFSIFLAPVAGIAAAVIATVLLSIVIAIAGMILDGQGYTLFGLFLIGALVFSGIGTTTVVVIGIFRN